MELFPLLDRDGPNWHDRIRAATARARAAGFGGPSALVAVAVAGWGRYLALEFRR